MKKRNRKISLGRLAIYRVCARKRDREFINNNKKNKNKRNRGAVLFASPFSSPTAAHAPPTAAVDLSISLLYRCVFLVLSVPFVCCLPLVVSVLSAALVKMMGSSSSSGSGYLDPHRVYELVTRLMPRQLLEYLDSVPGASRDLHWEGVKLVGIGKALLNVVSLPRYGSCSLAAISLSRPSS